MAGVKEQGKLYNEADHEHSSSNKQGNVNLIAWRNVQNYTEIEHNLSFNPFLTKSKNNRRRRRRKRKKKNVKLKIDEEEKINVFSAKLFLSGEGNIKHNQSLRIPRFAGTVNPLDPKIVNNEMQDRKKEIVNLTKDSKRYVFLQNFR